MTSLLLLSVVGCPWSSKEVRVICKCPGRQILRGTMEASIYTSGAQLMWENRGTEKLSKLCWSQSAGTRRSESQLLRFDSGSAPCWVTRSFIQLLRLFLHFNNDNNNYCTQSTGNALKQKRCPTNVSSSQHPHHDPDITNKRRNTNIDLTTNLWLPGEGRGTN